MFNLVQPRVALVLLPFCSTDTPPVGLAILTAILRQRGLQVLPMDLNLKTRNTAPAELLYLWSGQQMVELVEEAPFAALLERAGMLVEQCAAKILETEADVVGFSMFTTNARFTAEVARLVHQRDSNRRIIFGGPSCKVTGERQWVGAGLAEAWICGDGEDALPAVLEGEEEECPTGVILGVETDPGFALEH